MAANGNSLEWSNVSYKVATKIKKGYFNPFTTIEQHVILNNGESSYLINQKH